MNELFEQRNIIYLKFLSETDFTTEPISTEEFKICILKIWNLIPPDIRNYRNIEKSARKIMCLTPKNCPCRLCLNYIRHAGYVD